MERVELPRVVVLQTTHLLVWLPTPVPQPNHELLKQLTRVPRSRKGTRQSETSRRRQNFITGMNRRGGTSKQEIEARKAYLDEWRDRMRGGTDDQLSHISSYRPEWM